MNRDEAREQIKRGIPCTTYLKPAPNHRGNHGYCCPICGSGTHGTRSTGAVEYYQDTNSWYCHSCKKGGDVIDAYTAAAGCDYNEALSFLSAQMGITIDGRPQRTERPQKPETAAQAVKPTTEEKPAQNAAQDATAPDFTAYYRACCGRIDDPAATSYLRQRGISIETARRYNIGYDPEADPAAAPGAMAAEQKKHPTPRIIAPCTKDFYIARSIDPKTPAAYKAPNPKGSHTQLFNSAALYTAPVVFVVEGIFDALSVAEAGAAAICLNGKGNGKLLLQQLKGKPTQADFIICQDDDPDPKTAADTQRQAAELQKGLQEMGLKCGIYNIAAKYKASREGAEAKDANDVLRADREAFKQHIAEAIQDVSRDDITGFIEKIQTEAYRPYKTGLQFFDDLIGGGIIQQSLLLLMAAPGTGKTTLAQQIAETMAKEKKPVIYFNFEMSREQMLAKAISAKLYRNGGDKTALQILQGYSWTEEERAQILGVTDDYRRNQYPYIKYNPDGVSSELSELLSFLTATGEAAKAKGEPAPAAVIDYLHLIKSRDGLDAQELIKQAVTGLKRYAVDYNTFVIGIIATNRASNKGGRLTMESGRDSSNLEYTADYQLSLNYAAIDSGAVKPDDVEKIAGLQKNTRREMILRVLKSRFSQPGKSAQILFDSAHNIFYGSTDEWIPAAGFMLDNGAPAFADMSNAIMRI